LSALLTRLGAEFRIESLKDDQRMLRRLMVSFLAVLARIRILFSGTAPARVRITPKGKELLEQTRQAGLGQARELLKAALSDQELEQLDKLLKKVRDRALGQLGMEATPLPNSLDAAKLLADLT